MTQPTPTVNPWSDDDNSVFLRLRMKTFWNFDYFERIILPLLDLPQSGRVLDVGCGNGGISLLLAGLRRDLSILGVDLESKPIEDASVTGGSICYKLDSYMFLPKPFWFSPIRPITTERRKVWKRNCIA